MRKFLILLLAVVAIFLACGVADAMTVRQYNATVNYLIAKPSMTETVCNAYIKGYSISSDPMFIDATLDALDVIDVPSEAQFRAMFE